MGMFKNLIDKKQRPSQFDWECARTLREAILKRTSYKRAWSRSSWAKEFTILRQTVQNDIPRILRVLIWYRDHIKDEFVPVCLAAKTFRLKFDAIEGAMGRAGVEAKTITVTKEVALIVKRVRMLSWPKGSREQVPAAVQVSYDAYKAFRKKLYTAKNTLPTGLANRTCDYLLGWLPSPETFVEQYFHAKHKQLFSWAKWDGNLMKYVFTPNDKMFQAQGRDLANRYCSDARVWDAIMENMNES